MLVAALVLGGAGAGAGVDSSRVVRIVVGALVGLGAGLLLALALYVFFAARAVVRQRDEARRYARELEQHAEELKRWARRREIAEDFRRERMEDVYRLDGDDPPLMGGVVGEEHRWRATAAAVAGQLRDQGAPEIVVGEIDRGLAELDRATAARDDGYGDNQLRRVRGNIMAVCQNVRTMTVSHDLQPTPPRPVIPE